MYATRDCRRVCDRPAAAYQIEQPFDPPEPRDPPEVSDEPSDLDDYDLPCTDEDSHWDAFVADDNELDPLPERGDFESVEPGARGEQPD